MKMVRCKGPLTGKVVRVSLKGGYYAYSSISGDHFSGWYRSLRYPDRHHRFLRRRRGLATTGVPRIGTVKKD